MAFSLYIHVPFCRSRCTYCAFYSGEPLDRLADYPGLVLAEAALQSRSASPWQGPVNTLYFGGGTPSLLTPAGIERIVDAAASHWGLSFDAEVTLEANPGDALDIQGYRAAGVTRLSLGVQSLDGDTLARLGRRHLARDALSAALAAVHGGFSTVSADLLFGLPGLNLASLAGAVESLGQAGIGHVSLYSLEIHPATPLARDRDAGLLSPVTHEDEDRQWASLDAALSDRGFAPYEVSNYCLPGAECRHNKAYWDRKPYLGLGPGAHSYNPSGNRRSWNDPGLGPYAAALEAGLFPPGGDDPLSAADVVLESLFLGLRRPEPIDFHRLSSRVGADRRRLSSLLARASEEGLLEARPDLGPLTHAPTRKGMRAADGLAVLLAQAYACPPDSPASPPHSAGHPAGDTDPSPLHDAGSLESVANDEVIRIGQASSS